MGAQLAFGNWRLANPAGPSRFTVCSSQFAAKWNSLIALCLAALICVNLRRLGVCVGYIEYEQLLILIETSLRGRTRPYGSIDAAHRIIRKGRPPLERVSVR
jgi:hypothetical protein